MATKRHPRVMPVIIDTDVDIDDWMAILFLLGHQSVVVKGITVVGTGAAHLDPGTQNALNVIAIGGKPDIPVARGLSEPLKYNHAFPPDIRLPVDNLYGITLPPEYHNPNPPLPDAFEFLASTLIESKRKIAIVAIGPLTNIGHLIANCPEAIEKIERIYIMGGAVDAPGNVNDADPNIPNFVSEWNIYLDPVAAEIVFSSGIPITLVPLDATVFAPVTKEFYFRILQNQLTPSASFIFHALQKDMGFLESGNFYFWDPVAAAVFPNPDIGSYKELPLRIDTSNGNRSGQIIIDDKKGNPVNVCIRIDGQAFDDLFLNVLNGGKATYKSSINFYLDGEEFHLNNISPSTLLIDFLHQPRINKGGTKLVCGEAGCGACTVMEEKFNPGTGKLEKRAINSCVRPLCSLDGTAITTTQGIGSVKTRLDKVQHTIAANNGSQCGYCTPGFVMNMYSLLQNNETPTEKEIENHFDGNICRCTGYRPILEGFKKEFAVDYKPPKIQPEISIDPNYNAPVAPYSKNDPPSDFITYMKHPQPIQISKDGYSYFRPTRLNDVFTLKKKYGRNPNNFKLLDGNTSIGIYKTRAVYAENALNPKVLVDVSNIKELRFIRVTKDSIDLGANVTISKLAEVIDSIIGSRVGARERGLHALKKHIEVVANVQVRNVGSLAGNIYMSVNLGFTSDMHMVLATLGATMKIASSDGIEEYDLLNIPTYDQLPVDAVYLSIHIPFNSPNTYINTYKVRDRNQNSHAIVNSGYSVSFNKEKVVSDARLVYNGIKSAFKAEDAPHGNNPYFLISLPATAKYLKGKSWNTRTLKGALRSIEKEITTYKPPIGPGKEPLEIDGASWNYRSSLAKTLFYKFFVQIASAINPKEVGNIIKSAGESYNRPVSSGQQIYNSYPDELPVSEPLVKLSAFMQASGEAKYAHDMERPPHTLEAAFVYSLVSRGTFSYQQPITSSTLRKGSKITARELSDFLKDWYPGFVDYVTYADIPVPEANWVGIGGDDPIFVPSLDDTIPPSVKKEERSYFHPGELNCIGAPIGLVIAKDQQQARDLATFIRTECIVFNSKKAVTNLDEAIARKRFFPQDPVTAPSTTHIPSITRPGSNKKWLKDPSKNLEEYQVISGVQRNGFQNHFYLETMATLAVPDENKSMKIYTSTQTLADNQSVAAGVLGVSVNDIRIIVRRDGGAFGGKQTRSRFNSTATAIAAHKLRSPVRLVLDRNTNFIMCGNRHAFEGRYHAAFDKSGKIKGLKIDFYSDGGCTYDVSFPVMDLALMNSDNTYQIDTFQSNGQVCQTNSVSNTAFRSFGTVQCINIVETVIEHVAHNLGMDPEEVRALNLYRNGHYEWKGFQVTDQTLDVLSYYNYERSLIRKLLKIKNIEYPDRQSFVNALASINVLLEPSDMLTLEEYSNTSYDFTPYLQGLKYCDIQKVWNSLKNSSAYKRRRAAVETFNKKNKWVKKGISMIPLKYGVSYTGPRGTLNQGGAYVIAYSVDGSVLVQHGGVESGQGIQTKMAQIAAETLGIPLTYIKMGDTDTNVISDASPTAASTGSDLNGGAVQKACRILRARLEKFCEDLEQYTVYFARYDDTEMDQEQRVQIDLVTQNWRDRWSEVWTTIISLAYVNRINLAAEARFKTPHYSAIDLAHPYGQPFFYLTYSAAVTEVQVDILTGEHTVLRTDILYDTGKSLNPLIDIGQIEGAFVQGLGYVTTEEMIFQNDKQVPKEGFPENAMISYGTWNYKPPETKSIPVDFRVQLVDVENRKFIMPGPRLSSAAVKSSKGIGEPPLVLGNSVFFAIRHAVAAARIDQGKPGWFQFDAPATIQRIQTAVGIEDTDLNLK